MLQILQSLNLWAIQKYTADPGGIMSANLRRRNSKKRGNSLEDIPLLQTTLHTNKREHMLEKSVENHRENPG